MPTDAGTKFVVLTTQRSGSTWLMSVLNGIETVSGHGELFLPRPRSTERRWDSGFAYPRYIELRGRHGHVRPFSVFDYLSTFYSSPGSVGFKLMYSQLRSYPEIAAYLTQKGIPVVHLVRWNHLDVLTSFAVKRKLGKAHILSGEDRPEDVTVVLDTDRIMKDIKRLQRKQDLARAVLRICRLRHLEVVYEDLVRDHTRFRDICLFLDIPEPVEGLQSGIVKTRLGGQRQVIGNYEDVRRVLEGSAFTSLLD